MAPRIEFDLSFNLTKLPSTVYRIEKVKREMEKKNRRLHTYILLITSTSEIFSCLSFTNIQSLNVRSQFRRFLDPLFGFIRVKLTG